MVSSMRIVSIGESLWITLYGGAPGKDSLKK